MATTLTSNVPVFCQPSWLLMLPVAYVGGSKVIGPAVSAWANGTSIAAAASPANSMIKRRIMQLLTFQSDGEPPAVLPIQRARCNSRKRRTLSLDGLGASAKCFAIVAGI